MDVQSFSANTNDLEERYKVLHPALIHLQREHQTRRDQIQGNGMLFHFSIIIINRETGR